MSVTQATATASTDKKPKPEWHKYSYILAFILICATIGLRLFVAYTTWDELPGCASDGAKGGLSDIFKSKQVQFSKYIDIKTLTTTKEEITCNAVLAKSAGGTTDIDYRIFYEDKVARIVITRAEDKP